MQFSFFIALTLTVFSITVAHANIDIEALSNSLISIFSSIPYEDYKNYVACYKEVLLIYETDKKVNSQDPNLQCMREFFEKYPKINLEGNLLENLSSGDLNDEFFKSTKTFISWQHYLLPYKMNMKQLSVIASTKLSPSEKLKSLESYLKTVPEQVQRAFSAIILNDETIGKEEKEEYKLITIGAIFLAYVDASESEIEELMSMIKKKESKKETDQLNLNNKKEVPESETPAIMFHGDKNNAALVAVSSVWFVAAMMSLLLL